MFNISGLASNRGGRGGIGPPMGSEKQNIRLKFQSIVGGVLYKEKREICLLFVGQTNLTHTQYVT